MKFAPLITPLVTPLTTALIGAAMASAPTTVFAQSRGRIAIAPGERLTAKELQALKPKQGTAERTPDRREPGAETRPQNQGRGESAQPSPSQPPSSRQNGSQSPGSQQTVSQSPGSQQAGAQSPGSRQAGAQQAGAQFPTPPPPAPPAQPVGTGAAGENDPALSELELQAAVYSVAGLPEPFTTAILEIPTDSHELEVADSMAFLGTLRPFSLRYWIRKDGLQDVSGTCRFEGGYGSIPVPEGYRGGWVKVEATLTLIAYRFTAADRVVWPNRIALVRSGEVTRITGRRRVRVLGRPNIRLEYLPIDIAQINAHPQAGPAWKAFLEAATREEKK